MWPPKNQICSRVNDEYMIMSFMSSQPLIDFLPDAEFVIVDECRDYGDCDPYGFSICNLHKKWAMKCCAEYCHFCH